MGARPKGGGVTRPEEVAIRAFLETGSKTEAHRRAYPKSRLKGDARHSAAKELFRRGPVRVRLEELRAAQARKHEISLDRWLQEQAAIGFGRPNHVVDWGETVYVKDEKGDIVDERQSLYVRARKDLPDQALAMIESIKQTKDGRLEVSFHKKGAALDAIGKHFGWFEKDNAQAGKAAGEALVAGAAGSAAMVADAVWAMLQDANTERKGAAATAALKAAVEGGSGEAPGAAGADEASDVPAAAEAEAGGTAEGDPDDPFPDRDPFADLGDDEDGYETPA